MATSAQPALIQRTPSYTPAIGLAAVRTLDALARLDAQPNVTPAEYQVLCVLMRLLLWESDDHPDTVRSLDFVALCERLGGHLSIKKTGKTATRETISNGPRILRALKRLHSLGFVRFNDTTAVGLDKTPPERMRATIAAAAYLERANVAEVQKIRHGGYSPPTCPKCGSDVERVCRCLNPDCGHVFSDAEAAEDTANQLGLLLGDDDDDDDGATHNGINLTIPPDVADDDGTANQLGLLDSSPSDSSTGDEGHIDRAPPAGDLDTPPAQVSALDAAATLLLDVAGDEQDYAAMQPASVASKYVTIKRPITLEDVRDHLTGRYCFAIRLRSEQTRALGFEVDTAREFGQLKAAAELLQLEGARPALITSPSEEHPGGGALWLFFSAPVPAAAARHWAEHVAPILSTVAEVWPGKGSHLRLPAGCYTRLAGKPPCLALSVPDNRAISPGLDTWRHLATCVTPAEWVQTPPVSAAPPERGAVPASPNTGSRSTNAEQSPAIPAAEVWRHLHDTTPPCAEQLEPDARGKAKAPWRDEQQPSVHIYGPDKFHDYGDATKRGDRIELRALIEGKSKHELFAEALAELKAA